MTPDQSAKLSKRVKKVEVELARIQDRLQKELTSPLPLPWSATDMALRWAMIDLRLSRKRLHLAQLNILEAAKL